MVNSFLALLAKTHSFKFNKFKEIIIFDHKGEECQRLITNLLLMNGSNPIKSLYHQEKDELIISNLLEASFYVIPSKRHWAKLLWHEFNTYKYSEIILLDAGKIWVVGGYFGDKHEPLVSGQNTKIYDIKYVNITICNGFPLECSCPTEGLESDPPWRVYCLEIFCPQHTKCP